MAQELDSLLGAKNLSRQIWQGMLRFFNGRISNLEEAKRLDDRIRDDVIGRGLQVINDHIDPAVISANERVAELTTLRDSGVAIHDQLEEALEFGANTDLVSEGPGGENRYFTPARETTLIDGLLGPTPPAGRETLRGLSDALDGAVTSLKGGASAAFDSLGEVETAIGSIQTALTAKSDLGHTHTLAAVPTATAVHFRANVAGRLLVSDQVWQAAGYIPLTDGATITPDFSQGFNFTVMLADNRTLANPTNVKTQAGKIIIRQDATGSRLLSFGSNWKFAGGAVPTLSTDAGARDVLVYEVLDDGTILAALLKGV